MPFPFKQPVADDSEQVEAKAPTGSGTNVSGYVEDPTPKQCGTCEYLEQGKLCNQETVQTDPELEADPVSGLKVVNPKDGCCSFWEAKSTGQPAVQPQQANQTAGAISNAGSL